MKKRALVMLMWAMAAAQCGEGTSSETRDPWLWPFSSNSIWNTPIGSDAKYVAAGFAFAKHIDIDEELLYRVPHGAPERPVFAIKSWEQRAGGTLRLGSMPIEDATVVEDAKKGWTPNRCAAFLMPDGRTVRNLAPLCRPQRGGPIFAYIFDNTDLYGEGIAGSHGASRMSALGGSIRLGELTGAQPIRHALKVDIWCKKYAYFGDDRKGYRWPATGADSYADKKSYAGKNRALVMGSLLAIPPDATPESMKLKTPVGLKLFHALRDFGAYVVDDSAWDCHYLCAEVGVTEEVERALDLKFGGGTLAEDINTLFVSLAVVDNNAPQTIGGGGKPRVPLAPPLKAP